MRTLRIALVLGFIGLAVPEVGAGGDCKLATKGDSVVAKACREGGFIQARKLMKDMVKRAKAKVEGLDCKTCHEGVDDERYDLLKKDGRAQFDEIWPR